MSTTDAASAAILDYLQSAPGTHGPIDLETDLLQSGAMDSLLVMDLVCFLECRFRVRMRPADVNPHNLRSVRRLADYVCKRLAYDSDAA